VVINLHTEQQATGFLKLSQMPSDQEVQRSGFCLLTLCFPCAQCFGKGSRPVMNSRVNFSNAILLFFLHSNSFVKLYNHKFQYCFLLFLSILPTPSHILSITLSTSHLSKSLHIHFHSPISPIFCKLRGDWGYQVRPQMSVCGT